jgi:hypothetical protein
MWAWMGLALLVAVLYYMVKKKSSANSSSASQSPSTVNTPGGVDSSLVPQFVNQVYNQETPPAAPNVTVNNTVPDNDTPTTPPPVHTPNPNLPLNEILKAGHVVNHDPNHAVIGWTIAQKSPNATQIKFTINGPGYKNKVMYTPASATQLKLPKLQPGHTYVIEGEPIDAQGQAVGGPGNTTLITNKA